MMGKLTDICECGAKVNALGRAIDGTIHPGMDCKMPHTDTPWHVSDRAFANSHVDGNLVVRSETGLVAMACTINEGLCNAEDNTRFIVAAVNAYEELRDVCRRLVRWNANVNGDGIELEKICKAARAALKPSLMTPAQ